MIHGFFLCVCVFWLQPMCWCQFAIRINFTFCVTITFSFCSVFADLPSDANKNTHISRVRNPAHVYSNTVRLNKV